MSVRRPLLLATSLALALLGCQSPRAAAPLLGVKPLPAVRAAGPAASSAAAEPAAAIAPPAQAADRPAAAAAAPPAASPERPGTPAAAPAKPESRAPVPAAAVARPARPASLPLAADVGGGAVAGEVLAALKPEASAEAFMRTEAMRGWRLLRATRLGKRQLLRLALPEGLAVEAARAALAALPEVHSAMPNATGRPAAYAFANKDALYDQQWAHREDRADSEGAWSIVPASAQAKTIVAVIDSGLDVGHPEFAGRVVGARNYNLDGTIDGNVTDADGHGTHVAGIIGARGDDGQGCAGVAWGVKVMPIFPGPMFDLFSVVDGLNYAVNYRPSPDDGSRVRAVNMSLGFGSGGVSWLFAEAIAEARAKGVTVVVASGNDGADVLEYPAAVPGAIAVGSTGESAFWERLTPFSNHGPGLTLTAPGEKILSTWPRDLVGAGQDPYLAISGTSMASPFVAGVVGLIAARYDPQNAQMNATWSDQVRARLVAACDDFGVPGPDHLYGAGRINVRRAVAPATLTAPVSP